MIPCNPTLCIHKEKTIIQKDTRTLMFIAALFTTAKTYKQPKCPSTEEWMKAFNILDHLEWWRVAAALGLTVFLRSSSLPQGWKGSALLLSFSPHIHIHSVTNRNY